MSRPKPGDPDFVPRYPVLDLAPIEKRIRERRDYAVSLMYQKEHVAITVQADTDMLEQLLVEVRNLRMANEGLKEVIAALRGTGT